MTGDLKSDFFILEQDCGSFKMCLIFRRNLARTAGKVDDLAYSWRSKSLARRSWPIGCPSRERVAAGGFDIAGNIQSFDGGAITDEFDQIVFE